MVAARGEHQDRRALLLADAPQHVEAAQAREHDVEHDGLVVSGERGLETALAVVD